MPAGNGTSLAKIEANRRNAQKSTGPKTQEGKDKSKLNALKHGLVAQATVIPVGEAKESDTEFTQLLDRVMAEFDPQGFVEEMLTERIAICYWRLRRAAYAEVGEIREALDTSKGAIAEADLARFLTAKSKCRNPSAKSEFVEELQSTVPGLEFSIEILNEARLEFEDTGELCLETHDKLSKYLGYTSGGAFFDEIVDAMPFKKILADVEKPKPQDKGAPTCHRILYDIEKLSAKKTLLEENRMLQHEVDVIRSAIPLDVNRIVRYETAIERQLYKALDKLAELQRNRKAERQD